MPHRLLNLDEAAKCLHLPTAELERLVRDRAIPFETRGPRTIFRKLEVEAWASQRILSADARQLVRFHQQASRPVRQTEDFALILPGLLGLGQVDAELSARTKASTLREMAALAGRTGWVYDPAWLVQSLEAREKLSSTALPGGVAFLHPATQEPDQFERSFVALARTVQPIHFGAPDGRPSRLFFLLCSRDARRHLVLLSRLCLLAQKAELLTQLREAPDPASMLACLLAAERDAVEHGLQRLRTSD